MPKAVDVPAELRQFNKIFERFTYRFDYSSAFDDYLSYFIEVFSVNKNPELIERLKKTYGEYYPVLTELFYEHLAVQEKVQEGGDCVYDLVGTFYEVIRSSGKASRMGQFFTPLPICEMMAQMTVDPEQKGKGIRLNDPACGSGRTLIATQLIIPGNLMYGEDKDPMCTKMCAINFLLHGCVGQVCCMNSLWPEEWHFGYEVNRHLNTLGVPTIRLIEKHESFTFSMWETRKDQPKSPATPEHAPEVVRVTSAKQYTLFDPDTL